MSSAQSENSCQSCAGSAQQRADDRDRVGPGDVGDHVAAARAGVWVDQLGDDRGHRVAQPGGRTGREGFGHQSAKPGVLGAVAAQQALDGPVPKWAGGDALGSQAQPAGHREPRIAQHSPHQLVAHDFDTARVQRDRRLLPYLPHHSVCVIGILGVVMHDGRQPGIKDTQSGRMVGGHRFDNAPSPARSLSPANE